MLHELKKIYFKEREGFKVNAEMYLESSRTYVMELFCNNS